MSRSIALSPLPLLRLLNAPRVLLVLLGGGAWTLGTAWMGTMARFTHAKPAPEFDSSYFNALVAGMVLFGVPSLFGVVIGEAAQELFRRPLTRRLPGIQRRISGAALSVGLLVATVTFVAMQLGWSDEWSLRSDGMNVLPCPLTTFSIALLGYGAGAWLLVRVGYDMGWVLRFAAFFALAFFVLPLMAVGTESPLVAFALCGVASLLVLQRFRPAMVERMAEGSVPTVFGSLRSWADTGPKHPARAVADLEAPQRSGGTIDGWLRGRSFEQRSLVNGVHTPKSFLLLAAIPMVILNVGPLIRWVVEASGERGSLLLALSAPMFGFYEDPTLPGRHFSSSFVMLIGMVTAFQAVTCAQPLSRTRIYPLSRPMRAQLVQRVARRAFVWHVLATLGLGLAIGTVFTVWSGREFPTFVPLIGIATLASALLFPWLVLGGATVLHPSIRAGRLIRPLLLFVIPAFFALDFTARALDRWLDRGLTDWPFLVVPGLAAVLALGFWVLQAGTNRWFARADLV